MKRILIVAIVLGVTLASCQNDDVRPTSVSTIPEASGVDLGKSDIRKPSKAESVKEHAL